jgi:hypothetical protein
MPSVSGPQPLGALLSSALAFVRQYMKPILVGAVIFGTLAALLGGGVAFRAADGVNGMMKEIGMDPGMMEDLSLRIQNGDEAAIAEMETILNDKLGGMENGVPPAMKAQLIGMFAPLIGVAALVGIIIAIFSQAYFLSLAISPTQDAMAILRKTPSLFFPLLGLWIWIFLRSFAWIPVLGLIPAIILGPRFALSPVIMLKEKSGITESVRRSYSRTKGYWGKIFGNIFVAGVCMALAGIVAGIITGIIGVIIPFVGMWLQVVAKEVLSAFMTIFIVQLALTVMANPMGMAAAAPVKASMPAKTVAKAPTKVAAKKKK